MLNEDLANVLNAGYSCPSDAGSAWRNAIAQGVDMWLIERALAKTPWDRLVEHDQALGFAQLLQQAIGRDYE